MRADQLLVQRGVAPSRSAAQRLIERGGVRWRAAAGWAVPKKAGEELPEAVEIEVVDDAELRFVSRGGLKLEAALARCGLELAGKTCLDVGQGSGGFTDVLLQRGAARVVGVDVGHGQLHPRLASDPRVTALEGINARRLDPHALPVPSFDLVVGDLSFISLALVLPAVLPLLVPAADIVALVKPQFEVGRGQVGKGGIVRDETARRGAVDKVAGVARGLGLAVVGETPSP
ncbi:MAG: TlyA family RNA methyltransferase, partial [Rhizobacter sp.]|nr:TlyA family RNA methyltransferase [Rhizobacter sp.]